MSSSAFPSNRSKHTNTHRVDNPNLMLIGADRRTGAKRGIRDIVFVLPINFGIQVGTGQGEGEFFLFFFRQYF